MSDEPNLGGQPTKFSEDKLDFIKFMAEQGLTNAQMAEKLGITERTFYNWKNANEAFFHAIKDWKEQADAVVEASLYQRAKGYSHTEEKVTFDSMSQEWKSKTVVKHYAPDTRAAQYWLNNRKPEEYRDKKEVKAEVEHRGVTINFTKAEGTRSLEDIEDE